MLLEQLLQNIESDSSPQQQPPQPKKRQSQKILTPLPSAPNRFFIAYESGAVKLYKATSNGAGFAIAVLSKQEAADIATQILKVVKRASR